MDQPAIMMDCSEWGPEPESYACFRDVVRSHYEPFTDFGLESRFDFYARAAKAYAVVVTSEPDGNLILKKGPVMM